MKASRQKPLPMRNSILFDNQKNPLRISPMAQDCIFVNGNVGAAGNVHLVVGGLVDQIKAPVTRCTRSEEHTSELQSRGHLVCRLLLEKKKKITTYIMK